MLSCNVILLIVTLYQFTLLIPIYFRNHIFCSMMHGFVVWYSKLIWQHKTCAKLIWAITHIFSGWISFKEHKLIWLEVRPWSHLIPWNPAEQARHVPSRWSQACPFRQFPLPFCLQFCPYSLTSQATWKMLSITCTCPMSFGYSKK